MRSFAAVVAADEEWGIGRDGDLAWRLPGDMRWFRELTIGKPPEGVQNTVIMGRKTWDSIPPRYRPLPGRHNVVVSRNPELSLPEGVTLVHSLDEGLGRARTETSSSSVAASFTQRPWVVRTAGWST